MYCIVEGHSGYSIYLRNQGINILSGVFVMQLCEECGAELPSGAQFCGRCGRRIRIEDDISRSADFASAEDKSLQPSEVSMALRDSQELAPEYEKEEKHQVIAFPSENSAEDEDPKAHLPSEPESEESLFDPVAETLQEPQEHYPLSEDENEEPIYHGQNERTSTMSEDTSSETEILSNQLLADQSLSTQNPKSLHEMQNPYTPAQKPGSQPVSKCLLFSLVSLIAIIGGVAALIGVFHQNLPVFGGSSSVLSSSSNNEITDPNGSSLTSSVCMNASTPSSNIANQGSNFTLASSTGCSNIMASRADSTCLIFPYGGTNSHKYIVDISNAAISNSPYHLVLSVVDYTVPTMYIDAKHISIGLSEGSTGRNFSWFYRSGSVTVNHDERSGSMNVILVTEKGGNTLHIVGVWACGRQIKSS